MFSQRYQQDIVHTVSQLNQCYSRADSPTLLLNWTEGTKQNSNEACTGHDTSWYELVFSTNTKVSMRVGFPNTQRVMLVSEPDTIRSGLFPYHRVSGTWHVQCTWRVWLLELYGYRPIRNVQLRIGHWKLRTTRRSRTGNSLLSDGSQNFMRYIPRETLLLRIDSDPQNGCIFSFP